MTFLIFFLFLGSSAFLLLALTKSRNEKLAKKLNLVKKEDFDIRKNYYLGTKMMRGFLKFMADRISLPDFLHHQSRIKEKLQVAENPYHLEEDEIKGLKIISSIVIIFSILILFKISFFSFFIICLALGAIFYFPDLWLNQRIKLRKEEIEKGIPETIELLLICIVAGLNINLALKKVLEKTKGPLQIELARVMKQIELGRPKEEAFADLVEKIESDNLEIFVTTLLQGEKLGSSITNILSMQAEEMRFRRQQYLKEKAQKASVKILFPLIFLILPAFILLTLGTFILKLIELV